MSINHFEYDYRKLLTNIITNGQSLSNRTGVNTQAIFNYVMDIDINNGFYRYDGCSIYITFYGCAYKS